MNPYESPNSQGPLRRPAWVKLGLWGLTTRGAALGFTWFSLALAAACGVIGFWYAPVWAGLLLAFAALWYWLSIRWVDKHEGWP